jgi:hypothetical protein
MSRKADFTNVDSLESAALIQSDPSSGVQRLTPETEQFLEPHIAKFHGLRVSKASTPQLLLYAQPLASRLLERHPHLYEDSGRSFAQHKLILTVRPVPPILTYVLTFYGSPRSSHGFLRVRNV